SINDGPGIRTTEFLKGCPLNCLWCHNPEGRNGRPQLAFTPSLCIGCGFCFQRCPNDGHILIDGDHQILRDQCTECFSCTEECWAGALEVIGRDRSAAEILEEVMKDKPFYDESGGGMTISGGEPLVQFGFVQVLLEGAKARGLHTCLETCGFAPQTHFKMLAPSVDLFLYDYKESDPERHMEFTGQPNDHILRNLYFIDGLGGPIVLRCPIVPGLNLRDDHLEGIVSVAQSLKHCEAIHVMGHHALGEGKRARLGLPEDDQPGYPTMTREEVEEVVARLKALGAEHVVAG
ncbi:MAG: glycyl-radical enzyme activating protein, partial [bacterium]|nr:glycyl-radical enzyme activating protein [bacterium]